MRCRRVVYFCLLAASLVASSSSHSVLAASEARLQVAAYPSDASPAERGSEGASSNAPSGTILRGAGALQTLTPHAPARVIAPTATPAATAVTGEASPPEPPPTASVLGNNQVVVFYGLPDYPDLGVLGAYAPPDAARAVRAQAAEYDAINGDDGAAAMLDLVYAQAQADPTENGLYLRYLPDDVVQRYIEVANQFDVQVTLDLQIGRGDPLDEVRKIERYLRDPRVHVAIDPEYAVGPEGVPGDAPGVISGKQVNAIQDYVAGVVEQYNLPPKLIVVHQYLDDTVTDADEIRSVAGVDLVFNMDAFGGITEKAERYAKFSRRGHSRYHGFNVFLRHDDRVMSADEVLRLSPTPHVIFYQ